MKWRREVDFHGSRSYSEPPPVKLFSLMLSWLANVATGKLRGVRGGRSGSRRPRLYEEHGFSLLGARSGRDGERRAPVRAKANGRDWRVLP
jgi:hypothetical protein